MNAPTPLTLARHYIDTIREWADPADLQRLLAGKVEPSDILDHNEALAEAWFAASGTEMVFDPSDTTLVQTIEDAQTIAKRAGFLTSRLPTE